VAPVPDAPPPPEQVKMVKLEIITVPAGATIIKDGVPQGELTPTTVEVVDKEKDVKFVLQHDGYDDHEFSVNPKEKLPRDNKFTFTLKKPAKGVPPQHRPIPLPVPGGGSSAGPGSGSAARPGGGELGGDPFGGTGPRR
jgi:hypothetical protein